MRKELIFVHSFILSAVVIISYMLYYRAFSTMANFNVIIFQTPISVILVLGGYNFFAGLLIKIYDCQEFQRDVNNLWLIFGFSLIISVAIYLPVQLIFSRLSQSASSVLKLIFFQIPTLFLLYFVLPKDD